MGPLLPGQWTITLPLKAPNQGAQGSKATGAGLHLSRHTQAGACGSLGTGLEAGLGGARGWGHFQKGDGSGGVLTNALHCCAGLEQGKREEVEEGVNNKREIKNYSKAKHFYKHLQVILQVLLHTGITTYIRIIYIYKTKTVY